MLSISDNKFNKLVSSDGVIVENFFGPLGSFWTVMSGKWRWAEYNYDAVMLICVSLKIFHVKYYPLRSEDFDFYKKLHNCTYDIGVNTAKKRKQVQDDYRDRRRFRMSILFCPVTLQLKFDGYISICSVFSNYHTQLKFTV